MPVPPAISFELFPPRSDAMREQLHKCTRQLARFDPAFVSVTYGAGGSTRSRTQNALSEIMSQTKLEVAAHLTCVGASKKQTDNILASYFAAGIKRLVLLRGDMPEGPGAPYLPHPQGYANAAELVARAKQMQDCTVFVASYPEIHPDSPNQSADLDNLKRKVDAGADAAITQFFFEPEIYFKHLEAVRAAKINIPVIPGLMLQPDFAALLRMAGKCQASVPLQMQESFAGLDPIASQNLLIEQISELALNLANNGCEHLHFYILNRAEPVEKICRKLKICHN